MSQFFFSSSVNKLLRMLKTFTNFTLLPLRVAPVGASDGNKNVKRLLNAPLLATGNSRKVLIENQGDATVDALEACRPPLRVVGVMCREFARLQAHKHAWASPLPSLFEWHCEKPPVGRRRRVEIPTLFYCANAEASWGSREAS